MTAPQRRANTQDSFVVVRGIGCLLPHCLFSMASSRPPLTVGVAFGGVSPEHEVSVISSLQAAAALDRDRYRPVPLYIAKDGAWYTGAHLLDPDTFTDLDAAIEAAMPVVLDPRSYRTLRLRTDPGGGWFGPSPSIIELDVVLPGLHGGDGENGGLQGLLELFNVPYTGSGVLGSAVGMDKVQAKRLCQQQNIPVVDYLAFQESDWGYHEDTWLDRIVDTLGLPVVVKPARLGSSIGIAFAADRAALDAAIEEALRYDDKVLVEQAVQPLREINCSVLGSPQAAQASVLEEPVRTEDEALLTYAEKYMRGDAGPGKEGGPSSGAKQGGGSEGMASLDRQIPADLPPDQAQHIQDLAVRTFQSLDCSGVARIDFLLNGDTGAVFFNEINTIPGSFSFYLWEPSGVPFDELLDRMITLALDRHREKNGRVRSYDVNLLSERSLQGVKGQKQ